MNKAELEKCHMIELGGGSWAFNYANKEGTDLLYLTIERNKELKEVGTVTKCKGEEVDISKPDTVMVSIPDLECLKVIEDTLADIRSDLEAQLAEPNKAKTGRVGDDLSGVDMCELFVICSVSDVRTLENNEEFDTKEVDDVGFLAAIAQGRTFYDRPSAELFALREATEYKIWCEFDDDVAIIFNKWQESDYSHEGVNFDIKTIDSSVSMGTINNFLDTLSEEELNSIRSE